MSKSNAQRIFNHYYCDFGNYNKTDRVRLKDNGIYNQNTLMAKIVVGYSEDSYESNNYLLVTLQNYKSQKTWRQDKKDLIEVAIKENFKIIFVPELDIGFGIEDKEFEQSFVSDLIEVAKYSKEDIKTAVKVTDRAGHILGLAFNQRDMNGEVIHAEDILTTYVNQVLQFSYDFNEVQYISLLEPCESCLRKMLNNYGTAILYFSFHKDKWNTTEYFQLANDIWSKRILIHNKPIIYQKINDEKVNKFMQKHKEEV